MKSKKNINVAVTSPKIFPGWLAGNAKAIVDMIKSAVSNETELILFPEMALSGLVVTNNFRRDFAYAVPLDSPYIQEIQTAAKDYEVWVAFGFLERDGLMLYDSAVLIDDEGEIVLHYRRISRGWVYPDPPPNYGFGDKYPVAETKWGRVGFLICGDIFDAAHVAAGAKLDIVLCPVACSFDIVYIRPQEDWDANYWPDYQRQFASIGAIGLMSNYIDKPNLYHGGGFITDKGGQLLAQIPLYEEGFLSGTILMK